LFCIFFIEKQTENRNLSNEIETLRSNLNDNNELSTRLEDYQSEISTLEEKNQELQQSLADIENENGELNTRLRELEEDSQQQQKNVSF